MAAKRDYYEVLGVSKDADDAALKKAFRSLARRYHPDKNPDDDEAEKLFKEVQEAYAVLSNADQRRQYDMFGHDAPGGSPFGQGGFEGVNINLEDLFSGGFESIFSSMFGGGSRRASRGRDYLVRTEVTLEQMLDGDEVEVEAELEEACEACDGTGADNPDAITTCNTCGGAGQVTQQTRVGPFVQQQVVSCPGCRGEGRKVEKACGSCRGKGKQAVERTLRVAVPPGAEHGTRLRMRGRGEPMPNGHAGDLYIQLDQTPHEWFERDGPDLLMALPVGYPDMMLGGVFTLPHIDGKDLIINVPAGSRPSETIVIPRRGMPRRRGRGRGDVTVLLKMHNPKKVSRAMKKQLEEMRSDFGLAVDDLLDVVSGEARSRRR